jgi:hypothetical protein
MKIRPGRTRSLVGGVVALLVTVVGAVMLSSWTRFDGTLGIFMIVWVVVGLVAAAASFYNALSERGLPLYEVEMRDEEGRSFCPQCGRPVGAEDGFCRHCGARIGR